VSEGRAIHSYGDAGRQDRRENFSAVAPVGVGTIIAGTSTFPPSATQSLKKPDRSVPAALPVAGLPATRGGNSDDLAYDDLAMGFDVRTPPPEAGQARPSPKKAKGSPRFVHDSARPQPEPSVESQATAIDLYAQRSAADE
jgi:hypothetical protein